MKKILSFLLALTISFSILTTNCIQAHASVGVLIGYLLEACEAILVGSGAVSQNQYNNLGTSEVFSMTGDVLGDTATYPSLPRDPVANAVTNFLNSKAQGDIDKTAALILAGLKFYDFVKDHADSLDTVTIGEGFDLKGSGACLSENRHNGWVHYIYCDYIVISDDKVHYQYVNAHHHIWVQNGKITTDESLSGTHSAVFNDKYSYQLYGDARYNDGTPATDITLPTDSITKPEPIGTVDVGGVTYDVNGDGTVTVDGKDYPINDDGSVDIDGDKYYPKYDFKPYDDTALRDLLQQILNTVELTYDDTTEDVEAPVIGIESFDNLVLDKSIVSVFPFCLPFDFYHGIKLLATKPEAPRFVVPFEIPAYKSFPGIKKDIVCDFSDFEDAFAIVRWVNYFICVMGLIFVTFKIVKGVR